MLLYGGSPFWVWNYLPQLLSLSLSLCNDLGQENHVPMTPTLFLLLFIYNRF